MTAARCSQAAGEDQDGSGRLRALRPELDRWGIVTEAPAEGLPVCTLHLFGARCEIDLQTPGTLTLTYLPPGRDLRPHEAAWLALAVLAGTGPPEPRAAAVPDPGLPLEDAAARMLAACGMAVEPVQVTRGNGGAAAALLVANPADQSRGRLTIGCGRGLTWECRFTAPDSPAPGLSCSCIARVAAAVLAAAAVESLLPLPAARPAWAPAPRPEPSGKEGSD